MIPIKNQLIPKQVAVIYGESLDEYSYQKPHRYEVRTNEANYKILADIHFQEGPYAEGVNGITEMDLISILIARLEEIQKTQEVCKENAQSIVFLKEAQVWQRKRYGLKAVEVKKIELKPDPEEDQSGTLESQKEEKKENEQNTGKKHDSGTKPGRKTGSKSGSAAGGTGKRKNS